MSKLFEEALADAKKIKEIAEDNAKKAILESVTPKIREFIEEQLLESDDYQINEIDSDDENEENEDEVSQIDENSINNLLKMIGGEKIYESLSSNSKKNVLDKSIQRAINSLNGDDKNKILNITNKINQNIEKLDETRINNNVHEIQENNLMSKNEKYYEIDLKMLREAVEEEAEALEMSSLYEEEEEEGAKQAEEAEQTEEDLMREISLLLDLGEDIEEDDLPEELKGMIQDDEPEEGEESLEMPELEDEAEGEDELSDPEDAMEESLQEVFDVDPQMLRQELANIRRQLKEGNVDHHFGGKGESKAGVKGAYGGNGAKKLGHQKSFGGGAEGQDPFVNPPQINKLNEAIRKLSRTNRAQTEKLNKYRSAVQTLREQLEDLNLFNAKLLYVNKLLQNKGLTESQKKSVIKALDEAKNLNETKALYTSLTESLSTPKKSLNESTRYGSSSKVTTSSASKSAVGELSRWQTLAGLK
jgi:hypothetical protein